MRKKFKKLLTKSFGQIAILILLVITAIALYQVLEEYTAKNNYNDIETSDFKQIKLSEDQVKVYSRVTINKILPIQQGSGKLYCIAGDDDDLYMLVVDLDDYDRIQTEITNAGTSDVYGISKLYTSGLETLFIDQYNQVYTDSKLTTENFQSYFGKLVLVEDGPFDQAIQCIALGVVLCYLYIIIFAVSTVPIIVRFIRIKKKYSKEDFNNMNKELDDLFTSSYRKVDLLLTKSYILDFTNGFNVIEYSDVIWFYKEKKGLVKERFVIYNKDFKKMKIANKSRISFSKREKVERDDIFELIAERSSNALIGDTQENILEFEKARQIYKANKKSKK